MILAKPVAKLAASILIAGLFLLSLSRCAYQEAVVVQSATPAPVEKPPELPVLRRVQSESLPTRSYKAMEYTVAPWFHFKQAAASLTFDDGTLDQYQLAFPELEKRNLKATFFLITDFREEGYWQDFRTKRKLLTWDQAREIARAKHEIGSHSKTHAARLVGGDEAVDRELRESLEKINMEIRSQKCVSFSWPFWSNAVDSRALARKHYIIARTGGPSPYSYPEKNGGIPMPNPHDLYQINSMGILAEQPLEDWRKVGAEIITKGGWAVINLHGVDNGEIPDEALGWEAMPLQNYRALLDYIVAQDLWTAPLGFVARYIYEREAAVLRLTANSEHSVVLQLQDRLDDKIFDVALTFRLKLAGDWKTARVTQDNQLMWSRVEKDGLIVFDAFPDMGPITVTRLQ